MTDSGRSVQATGFGDLDGLRPSLAAHFDRHLRHADALLADTLGDVVGHPPAVAGRIKSAA